MGRTKKECSEQEHVDLCGGICWGTQKLRKKNGTGEYVGTCKFPCRLKEECIKASREEQENVQYSIANIPYNPVIGDSEEGDSGEIKEPLAEDQTMDIPEDYIERFLREHKCPAEMAPAFRDAFNQFFFMLEKMPRFTKVLSGAIVGKMSQADLARCEGLTRQAINIGISNEITKMVAPELKCGNLDGIQRVIFDLIRQGYSLGWIAKKMKISKSKVYRVKRMFVRKNSKSETKVKIRLPWKKKSQNARKKARWREIQRKKEAKQEATKMLEEMLKKMKG